MKGLPQLLALSNFPKIELRRLQSGGQNGAGVFFSIEMNIQSGM
jgi:hypothetical protein